MDFDAFSRLAREIFQEIPEKFRDGVDGLTVRGEALPHPALPGVFTLGQCLTEWYPSEWSGPDTLRSVVVLFHGSFQALAGDDPDFDWEGELWDTLTHELRHHLESLADEDDLDGVDYAMEEAFKRAEGEDFDPFYYQAGKELTPRLFQVEYDFFLERVWEPGELDGIGTVRFSWHGEEWEIPKPEKLGDVHYVWVEGPEVGPGSLQLVLVRKRGWKERLRGSRGMEDWELWESEARAGRAPGG